jgi:hypothetical protein
MTITLLAQVANDPKGAVLEVNERRAGILIRTGYAVAVPGQKPKKDKKEDAPWKG